jgi:hypothetical protein
MIEPRETGRGGPGMLPGTDEGGDARAREGAHRLRVRAWATSGPISKPAWGS